MSSALPSSPNASCDLDASGKLDAENKKDTEKGSFGYSLRRAQLILSGTDVLNSDKILRRSRIFDDPNLQEAGTIKDVLDDDSPYPEVRSAVANTDDPSISVSTLRSWVLGKHYFFLHHSQILCLKHFVF